MLPTIELVHLDVVLGGQPILHDITWSLFPGQHWAIFGENGSGKSTLMRLMRGDIWPVAAQGERWYAFDGTRSRSPLAAYPHTALVSAEHQERYHRHEWSMPGIDAVLTGLFNTDLLHSRPTQEQRTTAYDLLVRMGQAELIHKDVLEMSQGQLRQIMICRAMMLRPSLLLLDEVSVGLDAQSRARVAALVNAVAESGTSVVMTTHRQEEALPCITHAVTMQRGRIQSMGPFAHTPIDTLPEIHTWQGTLPSTEHLSGDTEQPAHIHIQQATVLRNDTAALQNINWTWKPGENWALRGRNGAGKSTLLKLIYGDLLPVHGGSVVRFGRATGASIWDARRRMGLVSAELQAGYHEDITAEEVVVSGLRSSVGLNEPAQDWERQQARQMLQALQLEDCSAQPFSTLSYGLARRVMFARALIQRPSLLILDEPFDGLDAGSRARVRELIADAARDGINFVLVSHHDADILPEVTHETVLDHGHITAAGPRR